MQNFNQCNLFIALFLLVSSYLGAQELIVMGKIVDQSTEAPLPGVQIFIEGDRLGTISDENGGFTLRGIPETSPKLIFSLANYQPLELDLAGKSGMVDLGTIEMLSNIDAESVTPEDIIPTITLSASDLENDDPGGQNISGLLTASRDVFISAAAFTFGPRRFRIRGFDSENTNVFINGAPMNDLESGRPYWGSWGGLNDVLRNRNNSIGLGVSPQSFGGVGGVTTIDARASKQRKQLRVSYANSNRTYRHRIMATYSTGKLPDGWAFSFSASRRWAEESYVPGTFFDAYSYFASVEKQINDKHSISFTGLGAPSRRGRNTASTQEFYDLAGTNYYNPWWGYQNGEKRNARISTFHQPLGILSHDWKIANKTSLITAVSYQNGRGGSTAIDWFNASNPNPDFFRNSLAFMNSDLETADDLSVIDRVEQFYRNDEANRQIDWHALYNKNRQYPFDTIHNVNGIEGNTVIGNRANYILEERRYDSEKINFNTIFETILSKQVTLQGGLGYQYFKGHNFKVLEDLLGAEFFLDINQFARRDSIANPDFWQSDLQNPNRLVREGETFGYDYNSNIHKALGWVQADITTNKADYFLALELSNTRFWRTGNYQNGQFPDNSLGDSEKQKFTNYGAKAGITYKIDGRNYLFGNVGYLTRAPFFRNAFTSPRTRNQVVTGLTDEKIFGIEGGYLLRAPYAKVRAVGYFNTFQDQFFNRSLLVQLLVPDEDGNLEEIFGFGNYIVQNIDKRHFGVELAGELQVAAGLTANAAVALGQYLYSSNPTAFIALDNDPENLFESRTIYAENYRVPGTPQSAATLGLSYRSAKYWFANVNFNYIDDVYLDFFLDNRTQQAVTIADDPEYAEQFVDPNSALWREIIDQRKGEGAFSVDIFGGKSWKFNNVFLYLTVGVNNLLNDQDFITGGFEQFTTLGQRISEKNISERPPRIFYGFGRNYFINLALRM